MNIELHELADLIRAGNPANTLQQPADQYPFQVGDDVYIRTVTHHYTGHITNITGEFITLGDAAWIADSGRWTTALTTGTDDDYPVCAVSLTIEEA